MYKTNLRTRDLRAALLTGAATATVFAFVGPAVAQPTSSAPVENVVVTGSRLPQTGLTSVSPVTTVGQEEAKFQGTTNIESLLNNLPQVFAGQTNTLVNGASSTATVDLRGLGSARTLVLVDGRRLMPGDPFLPVPDLNQIPAAMVERVEVETGGASAIYGSDALAGVVNFIMRKDFEGVEVDGQWSMWNAPNDNSEWRQKLTDAGGAAFQPFAPENTWDGQKTDATVVMGVNTDNGKGNITAYIGWKHEQSVFQAKRDYSACTLSASTSSLFCGGSSNKARFISFDARAHAGNPSNFYGGSTTWVPYTGAPSQLFNFGALNYEQRPDTRWTGGFFSHYEVAKYADVYAQFMFMDDDSVGAIAPTAAFGGAGLFGGRYHVSCNNPYLTSQENYLLCGGNWGSSFVSDTHYAADPFHSNQQGYFSGNTNLINGIASIDLRRRNIEGGDRKFDVRHTSYRAVLGVKGDLGDGWSYDVYGEYSRTDLVQTNSGDWSKNRIQDSLIANYDGAGNIVCTSGDNGCVPVDFFHGIGSLDNAAMQQWLAQSAILQGHTVERVISGQVTGDLGAYGGKFPWAKDPIQVAVGAEYRNEGLEIVPDDSLQSGDAAGSGGVTSPQPFASFQTMEGFAEVKIPVIQDAPFAKLLQLNGAYRYSDYSSVGTTDTYEYGVEWQPIDDIRLRASYQRAVRAPNVLELFTPQSIQLTDGTFNDPCYSNPAAFAHCAAATGGASLHGTTPGDSLLSCPASQCNQQVGGNTSLSPETADTRSIGVVLTPTFLPGFTATIDYFNIKITGFIGTFGVNNILNECYVNTNLDPFFCGFVHRNGDGQIIGNGYVENLNTNTGRLQTKGWDFDANYSTDLSDWGLNGAGSLAAHLSGTLLNSLTVKPFPFPIAGDQLYDCAGLYGSQCGTPNPKWRHSLRVTWTTPWDVDVSMQWRYYGGVDFASNSANTLLGGPDATVCANGQTIHGSGECIDNHFPSISYIDLSGVWHVWDNVELRGGVNNLFAKEPPVSGHAGTAPGNGNTFPGVYDALGRYVYVGATVKL